MDSPRLLNAVAARVVAWHNRHPLARRISLAQVHSVGYVVLPFAVPAAPTAPGAPGAVDTKTTGSGQGGSLRERALARSRQGGQNGDTAALPPPVTAKPLPAETMPPGAQANFDENFIPPLKLGKVVRWARTHGRPLQQALAGVPLREVLALPLPAGLQPLPVLVLTAAIEVGNARRRVLLATTDSGAVLGRRVPSAPRAGLCSVLLLAAVAAATLLPRDPLLGAAVPVVAAASAPALPAASAATATLAPPTGAPLAEPAAAAAQDAAPVLAAHATLIDSPTPAQAIAAAAPTPSSDPYPAPSASASASASTQASAAAASSPESAATATATVATAVDTEPRLGRIELPPLNLPRNKQAKSDARDFWRATTGMPPAALGTSASALSPTPAAPTPAAATSPAARRPPGAAAFAVSSRVLRTRAEAEQVRDAMKGLLRSTGVDGGVQVEVMAQGDDWRVVGWPFGQRGGAEKAKSVLVSRGMRVEVVDF